MPISIRVSLTVPKEILNAVAVRDAIHAAQQHKTGPEVKRLFQRTTEGFRSRPTWNTRYWQNWDSIGVEVKTGTSKSAEIYALVNAGSPPHYIYPKKEGGWLRFKEGYTAGTHPRSLTSINYKRWGRYQMRQSVNHPGFKAREFDQEIAEQYMDTFHDDMQDAIMKGAMSGSNHS